MKALNIKSIIRITAYILVVAVVVSVFKFASAKSTDTEKTDNNEILFTPTELKVGEEVIAENDNYMLSSDISINTIRLTDKKTGKSFCSAPESIEENEELKRSVIMELSSLLFIKYADRDSNVTIQNSVAGALNKKNVSASLIENGIRFEYYFSTEGFLIPLEIKLTENGMTASVLIDEIEEKYSDVKLTTISVLPNFGANGALSDGYMFVPDGSGAVISYDYCESGYSQRVYGNDPSVSSSVSSGDTQQTARLPVFGATDNNKCFVGIIASGDTRANVIAVPPTEKSPYGTVYNEFIYREKIVVDISQQTFESTQANLFEREHCSLERFTTEYRFPTQCSYVGMANTYRNYLMDNYEMKPIANSKSALQLQLIGGIMHSENFLGIPVNRVLPITDYNDAVVINDELSKLGVRNVCINYLYWNDNGTDNHITLGIDTESRLGNIKALENAISKVSKNGEIYLNLNFTELYESHSSFSTRYDSARTVMLEPVAKYEYYLSTYRKNNKADPIYLLNALSINKAVDKFVKKTPKAKYKYSINSMGNTLYSDFGEKAYDRAAMSKVYNDTFEKINQKSNGMLFYQPNAYAFKYAKVIQGVPTDCSYFLCEDYSVPFYSIALHGLVQMGTTPANNGDSQRMLLKAAENGINITYTLGKQNTNMFKGTNGDEYSYISSDYWLDRAAEDYIKLEELISDVECQKISEHIKLSDGVYKTKFENGLAVIVNYTGKDFEIDSTVIEANNFKVFS